MKTDKGGRPEKAEHLRRSVTRTFRVTETESQVIEAAAAQKRMSVTSWMRDTLLRAARRMGKEGGRR